jgi:hypothetical protein
MQKNLTLEHRGIEVDAGKITVQESLSAMLRKNDLTGLLEQVPTGTIIQRSLILNDDEDRPKLRWEVKHKALDFSVVRESPAQALHDFIWVVEKRGLRSLLDAQANACPNVANRNKLEEH